MNRNRIYFTWLVVFATVFTLVIVGVIFFAPSSTNGLQIVARGLFVIAIIVAFTIIRKKVKRICRDKINN